MGHARTRDEAVPSEKAPWTSGSTTGTDCTFHQLAPYIGRIKTSIAQALLAEYTSPGDLVVDPFCGSGVIPLEAAIGKRRVVAADVNPYGVVLTRAKLHAPPSEEQALQRLIAARADAEERICDQDLRRIPAWVREFFHPETLRNALALRDALVERRDWFLLSCLLGILHHQRPGFLSYPSSHLVPYLRNKLFPRRRFPTLYEERDVYERMEAKLRRTFRRPACTRGDARVLLCDSRRLKLTEPANAIITSPPYMNELDYVRDNRLRLWFLTRSLPRAKDIPKRDRELRFRRLMASTFSHLAQRITANGTIIVVVGDASRGARRIDSAETLRSVFRDEDALSDFRLTRVIEDTIPDVRRSRRDLRGTKRETILVFRRAPYKRRSVRGEGKSS